LNSTYLIIDALDECVAGLPELLDFIVQTSSVSSYVKWVVSSRNWPDIEERLEKAGHKLRLSLELNTESGLDSLYKRMMQHISNSDDADLCRRTLALIAPSHVQDATTRHLQLRYVGISHRAG